MGKRRAKYKWRIGDRVGLRIRGIGVWHWQIPTSAASQFSIPKPLLSVFLEALPRTFTNTVKTVMFEFLIILKPEAELFSDSGNKCYRKPWKSLLFFLYGYTELYAKSDTTAIRYLHPLLLSVVYPTNLSTLLQAHLPHSHLQIHARIFQLGAHQDNLIATHVIDHYPSLIALRIFHQLQNPKNFPFNAIISLVRKLLSSRKLFDEIPDKRVVSCWTYLMTGFAQSGQSEEALQLFHAILGRTCFPKVIPCTRETCHDSVNTVLVYLFGKWGKIEKSREGFDRISASGKRNVVPWACAQIDDLSFGCWVHEYLISVGHKDTIGSNQILATSLIDMYSKSGNLDKAKEVFEHTVSKDVVLFNSMIMGLAVCGEGEDALRLLYKMPEFGLQPNAGMFLGALSCIEEAIEVVTCMPFKANNFVWGALLGGCLLHSRAVLAQVVFRRLVEVDPYNSAGYVMLANALASDGQWSEVSDLRMEMKGKGIMKQPGSSWIIVDGVVDEFLVGCLSHPKVEDIYHTLAGLVKHMKVSNHYHCVLLLDKL
ncbi:hypothetical protein Fmac_000015 [Flemingia macrophylla]|uniref:Pentatricopeptide repeat-containing protein n=1 Tax=Flemingia macrophylla TaxID=520843 RepID=A0ABD1ND28_9FABA